MNVDDELRRNIIETNITVRHITKKLDEGTKMFKEHEKRIYALEIVQVENCGERLRIVENNQKYMAGKLTIILMTIGALVLFLSNLIFKLWK